MSQKSSAPPVRVPAEKLVRDIRRATRKHHSAEDTYRSGAASPASASLVRPSIAGMIAFAPVGQRP
jgi:hypothetical protein